MQNPATWNSLRAYRHPYQTAVCALRAADVDLTCQRKLTVGDVSRDGRHVTTSDGQIRIRDDAAVFARALCLHRMTEGAGTGDPLFAHADGTQISIRKLARVLSDAATDLGVVLYSGQVRRSSGDRRLWRWGRGISIKALNPTRGDS